MCGFGGFGFGKEVYDEGTALDIGRDFEVVAGADNLHGVGEGDNLLRVHLAVAHLGGGGKLVDRAGHQGGQVIQQAVGGPGRQGGKEGFAQLFIIVWAGGDGGSPVHGGEADGGQ